MVFSRETKKKELRVSNHTFLVSIKWIKASQGRRVPATKKVLNDFYFSFNNQKCINV